MLARLIIQFKTGGKMYLRLQNRLWVLTGHYLGTVVLYMKEKISLMYLDNIINQNDKFYIIDENKDYISPQSELYRHLMKKYLGDYRLEDISDIQAL